MGRKPGGWPIFGPIVRTMERKNLEKTRKQSGRRSACEKGYLGHVLDENPKQLGKKTERKIKACKLGSARKGVGVGKPPTKKKKRKGMSQRSAKSQ